MKIIEYARPEDDLSTFGKLLHFAALVYEDETEGRTAYPFMPGKIYGNVVFAADYNAAKIAFNIWQNNLKEKRVEEQFLTFEDEEGFVAIFESPRSFMVVAASNVRGFETDSPKEFLPNSPYSLWVSEMTWEQILEDVFGEEIKTSHG